MGKLVRLIILFGIVGFVQNTSAQVPTLDVARAASTSALALSSMLVRNSQNDISTANATLIPLIKKNNKEIEEIERRNKSLMTVYNAVNDKVKEIKLIEAVGVNLAVSVKHKYYILTFITENSSLYTPEFVFGIKKYMEQYIKEQRALNEALEEIVGDVVKNGLKAAIFNMDDKTRLTLLQNINKSAKTLNLKGERIKNVLTNSAIFLKNNSEYEKTLLYSYTNIFSNIVSK